VSNIIPQSCSAELSLLRGPRRAALVAIAALVAAASLVSFGESYRGLYVWAHHHGLAGRWAAVWPLQVDVFIAVGELALFVGLADRWSMRSRIGAWLVTLAGLAVSVAGNVGHIGAHDLASRATAAVPPLAASAALAVGLGVLKRVVATRTAIETIADIDVVPTNIDTITVPARPPLSLAWPDGSARVAAIDSANPRPAQRTRKPSTPAASRSRRAASILAKSPDVSGAELGRRLGVSERSGRPLLANVLAGS
jgi:Protein of unknown function (DUF2637)